MAGVPTGIRTRVSALKGPRPRPLDDGDSKNIERFDDSVIVDCQSLIANQQPIINHRSQISNLWLVGRPGIEPGTP